MAGLGALLAASVMLFTVLKWFGAAYLVYLDIKLWRAPVEDAADEAPPLAFSGRRIFFHAVAVTALNPKSIVFFVAFLPQFIDPEAPLMAQLVLLEATFLALAGLNATLFALGAAAARRAIRRPAVQRAVNRAGGGLLIGAGVVAVAWNRASQSPTRNEFECFQALARRRVRSWMLARKIQASAVSMAVSKSLASRRFRLSQASVRSTTHRRGRSWKPVTPAGRLTISSDQRPIRFSAPSSLGPAWAPSAKTWRRRGKWRGMAANTAGAPSRSWMSAPWTTTATSRPPVSVRM